MTHALPGTVYGMPELETGIEVVGGCSLHGEVWELGLSRPNSPTPERNEEDHDESIEHSIC